MKKISLFTLALSACMATLAQNQHLTTSMTVEPRFGIKAGANLSEFKQSSTGTSTSMPDAQNRTSFEGGFLYNMPLGNMFRLQPELYYSGQGSKLTQTTTVFGTTSTYNADVKLNYVNLPVLLQLQTEGGFFVELGPQIGYLVSAKQIVTGSGSNSAEQDVKDQLRKMDFAAAGGIGYLSRIGLGIDVRYVYGFRDIYDTENNANSGAPETKNRVIQIGLLWQFGAGK